ncbi:MAG: hypothetical protein IKR18_09710 [Bacteroidaceae bacterium]|nr:hypothetical protein [Bacteroidaceae bacterium]
MYLYNITDHLGRVRLVVGLCFDGMGAIPGVILVGICMLFPTNFYLLPLFYACTGKPATNTLSVTFGS